MKKLNVAKVIDQWGWAYWFLDQEQKRYSKHNIIPMKWNEVDLDGIDVLCLHSPDIHNHVSQTLPLKAKEKGIKVIGSYSGAVQQMYSYTDLLLTISPQSYWLVKSRYPNQPTVFMPESVDANFFTPKTDYSTFKVGWAGRPCKVKRPHLLDRLEFDIIKQQEWGKKHFVDGRGLEPMREYYQSIDCLVLTSSSECMPRVVMEAMACGLPVVSTDVGGVRMLLDNSCVVRNGDENEIVFDMNFILNKLCEDKALREKIGKANRQWVSKYFAWEQTARIWDDLFEAVYTGSKSSIHSLNSIYVNDFDHIFEDNKTKYYKSIDSFVKTEQPKELIPTTDTDIDMTSVLNLIFGCGKPFILQKKSCLDCLKFNKLEQEYQKLEIKVGKKSHKLKILNELGMFLDKVDIEVGEIGETKNLPFYHTAVEVPSPVFTYLKTIYPRKEVHKLERELKNRG